VDSERPEQNQQHELISHFQSYSSPTKVFSFGFRHLFCDAADHTLEKWDKMVWPSHESCAGNGSLHWQKEQLVI